MPFPFSNGSFQRLCDIFRVPVPPFSGGDWLWSRKALISFVITIFYSKRDSGVICQSRRGITASVVLSASLGTQCGVSNGAPFASGVQAAFTNTRITEACLMPDVRCQSTMMRFTLRFVF